MGSGHRNVNLPDLGTIYDYIPMPSCFHSFLEEGPFESCTVCKAPLIEDGTHYIIEKGYHREEVIFEYAICMSCRGALMNELSAKSVRLINDYFDERVDLVERRKQLLETCENRVKPWIDTCVLTGRTLTTSDTYQVCGQCDGSDLLFTYLPYAISEKALEDMLPRLSRKTRERLDNFTSDFLGLPPEVKDLNLLVV